MPYSSRFVLERWYHVYFSSRAPSESGKQFVPWMFESTAEQSQTIESGKHPRKFVRSLHVVSDCRRPGLALRGVRCFLRNYFRIFSRRPCPFTPRLVLRVNTREAWREIFRRRKSTGDDRSNRFRALVFPVRVSHDAPFFPDGRNRTPEVPPRLPAQIIPLEIATARGSVTRLLIFAPWPKPERPTYRFSPLRVGHVGPFFFLKRISKEIYGVPNSVYA